MSSNRPVLHDGLDENKVSRNFDSRGAKQLITSPRQYKSFGFDKFLADPTNVRWSRTFSRIGALFPYTQYHRGGTLGLWIMRRLYRAAKVLKKDFNYKLGPVSPPPPPPSLQLSRSNSPRKPKALALWILSLYSFLLEI